ncbi:MAG TPA: FxLYD domain-containing protein [Gemmatimonadaceae bacterium]|nr:FxLYD domain-containing protein [Gemmatimonadaceae bacterium]
MLVFRSTAITSLVFATMLALPAAAQEAKQCTIDEGKPSEVARAYLTISQVAGTQGAAPADEQKKLASAVHILTENTGAVENPIGHAYELGKLLVLWTVQPNVPLTAKRGTIGYATNPDSMVNLPAAIDSAFGAVETAMPECEVETLKWRSQKAWINLVNGAIQELNAGSLDSADAHARLSLLFNKRAPYGWMVMAQVADRRQKTDSAIDLFQRTIAAAKDSAYEEVRTQSLLNLGNLAAAAGANASPNQQKYLGVARTAFETLVKDTTVKSAYRGQAGSGLVTVYLAMGDTAAARATYQPQLQNPSAYTFNELVQAGVWASKADDAAAGLKLFHAAYEMNPYHRDALANLTIFELKAQHYDTALALVTRLHEVDPDGDNGRVATLTYAGLAKKYGDMNRDIVTRFAKTKDAKLKKVLTDSATITADSNRFYTDLAVKANIATDSMPVRVRFSEFSDVANKVTLAGVIENNTASDKTFTLKVDFLDKDGKVVASQQTTVGPVSGQSTGQFSMTVTAPGITAFKYAPLD